MDTALILSGLGALIVAGVMFDFLATTISIRTAGPWSRLMSEVLARALGVFPDGGRIAQYQGPIILSALAATWIGGLWLGWSLVFAGGADMLTGPKDTPVGIGDILGFTGSTISTMGLGVVTPQSPVWHIMAVFSSISGMVVLTLAMTFVLNVTQIANQSRAFRRQLDRLREALGDLGPGDGVEMLLTMDDTLVSMAVGLRQSRVCFPLATLYDRADTRDDVERAARNFVDAMPASEVADTPSARRRITMLADTLTALAERRDRPGEN